MTTQGQNLLYYGDNLDVLRRYLKDETVDLIYLDPPFNSNATYKGPNNPWLKNLTPEKRSALNRFS